MSSLKFTPVSSIAGVVEDVRKVYATGRSRPLAWREEQIRGIKRLCEENTEAITAALAVDLRRPKLECVLAEAMTVVAEADEALANIRTWAKKEEATTPAILLPGKSYVIREPVGVVLIIGAWNFPIQLLLNPLISAVSAGNVAVIKPSEVSPACAALIEQLLPRYVDREAFRFVQGGVPETTELLKQRFDHICYTGNGMVAEHIMTAAAKHLTPVTLELGGKSPVIVDKDANLTIAANRIVVNKCMNAGQVCLSPDYILAHKEVVEPLTEALIAAARRMYGADMKASPDFGRIVNDRHFKRVKSMLDGAHGGKVVLGGSGECDASQNYVPLTLIREPKKESAVMSDEIFGPLLPILSVGSVDEAISFVNSRPKPLALYIFGQSSSTVDKILSSTSSGGAVVNDAILHNAVSDLPFGGVGPSGMGAYHGRWGFDNFSHRKAVFEQPTWVDPHALMYPPYSDRQLSLLQFLFAKVPALPKVTARDIAFWGLAASTAYLGLQVFTVARGGSFSPLVTAAVDTLSGLIGK